MSGKTIIGIIVVSILFVGLLLSSIGLEIPDPPVQDNGTHTGYPAWHPPFPGYDGQKQEAVIILSALMMAVGGYFAYQWTYFDTKVYDEFVTIFVDKDGNKTPTTYFNRSLAIYALVTAVTGTMYYLVDVGKIWATFGVFHNACELVILVSLHQGGRIESSFFIPWAILYVATAGSLSILLNWPYDGLWFKLQGLCLDYALVIQFTRLYCSTCKEYSSEADRLLSSDVERARHGDSDRSDRKSIGPFRPCFLVMLIVGSFLHIFGNIFPTIWFNEPFSYHVLSLTYCFTYPLYAYFVYLDTHSVATPPAQKYILLPDTSRSTVILVTLSCVFLSLLTGQVGILANPGH